MSSLVQAWQNFSPAHFPRLLAGDEAINTEGKLVAKHSNYKDFIESDDFGSQSTKFHLNLLPQPFIGNLSQASVFILMLNPGFSPGDYYVLEKEPDYAAAIERNLAQQNAAAPYPFFFLNPQFAWTAGGQWWRSKFRAIAEEPARLTNTPLPRAFQRISRHVACLEMYPYHSQSFKKPRFKLTSKELMCRYVKTVGRGIGDCDPPSEGMGFTQGPEKHYFLRGWAGTGCSSDVE